MKNVFFALLALLLIINTLHAQPQSSLLEQRKQLLLTSKMRLSQLADPIYAIYSAKREVEADLEKQIRTVQQSVESSYNQANGAIKEKRTQGTVQDLSLLGSTGDLGSGALMAGFNMLNRKSALSGQKEQNETNRKQAEQQAEEIRRKKMASIEQQYAEQVAVTTQPVIAAMNAFFRNRPPAPRLPGPATPSNRKSVYVYFGKPSLDRILFSDVWRVDQTGDGTWTKVEAGREPFDQAADLHLFKILEINPADGLARGIKYDVLEKASDRLAASLVYPLVSDQKPEVGLTMFLLNNLSDYAYNDIFTVGAFSSAEAALQHQVGLMQQALRANIAVEVVATPPQVSPTDTKQFIAQQRDYWGSRKSTGKP